MGNNSSSSPFMDVFDSERLSAQPIRCVRDEIFGLWLILQGFLD